MINQDYNDENFINNLVDTYRDTGDEQYRIAILAAFHPYFRKYTSLLCTSSQVDLKNKDTIRLLRLFMSSEDRASDESCFCAGRKLIPRLRETFKDYTQDDLYDELVCYFLEQLNRYKPMIANNTPTKHRISFTHFMQVNMRFKLFSLIKRKAKDAMSGAFNLEFEASIPCPRESDIGVNWNPIDLRWVQGSTTSDLFKDLTEMDRYILFLKYESEDKKALSDYEIARLTGLDRMYVRRKFLAIKDKLKQLIEVV